MYENGNNDHWEAINNSTKKCYGLDSKKVENNEWKTDEGERMSTSPY